VSQLSLDDLDNVVHGKFSDRDAEIENVVHGKFLNRDTETARELLGRAIEAYEKEWRDIKDPASANTWVVYPAGRRPQKRIEVSPGKVRQHAISAKEAAQWELARVRRERKQELTTIINELRSVFYRGSFS
jgi:hypothetical protein